MHVGMCAFFQNLGGRHTDREVYRHEIALADLAEPLGFESIWAAEHHFTPYDMCPSTAQFLTYMAGRTRQVRLGSMVVVLPWHDPVRVAEEITVLDHLSDGRVILGLGRGLARAEFEAFRVPMDESRERFVEYADAILGALETGYIEYQGAHYRQPRAAIRPSPFRSFRGRTYVAAVSPESAPIVARFGLGVLIIPQKPWDTTVRELADYRRLYRETNGGAAAPRPLIATFVACHEDGERARARCSRPTSVVTAAPRSNTTSSPTPGWRGSRATSTTEHSQETSPGTARIASCSSSPTSRRGGLPTRSTSASASTSGSPTAGC